MRVLLCSLAGQLGDEASDLTSLSRSKQIIEKWRRRELISLHDLLETKHESTSENNLQTEKHHFMLLSLKIIKNKAAL